MEKVGQEEVVRNGVVSPQLSGLAHKVFPCLPSPQRASRGLKSFEGRVATSGYNKLSITKALE